MRQQTMTTNDKQNITIRLAGQPKMPLVVDRCDEELMRRAEKLVNELWSRWIKKTYAAETPLMVMSRVAFQFAVLYLRGEREAKEFAALDSELDEMLKNLPGLD